jgi:hypothetical protein
VIVNEEGNAYLKSPVKNFAGLSQISNTVVKAPSSSDAPIPGSMADSILAPASNDGTSTDLFSQLQDFSKLAMSAQKPIKQKAMDETPMATVSLSGSGEEQEEQLRAAKAFKWQQYDPEHVRAEVQQLRGIADNIDKLIVPVADYQDSKEWARIHVLISAPRSRATGFYEAFPSLPAFPAVPASPVAPLGVPLPPAPPALPPPAVP